MKDTVLGYILLMWGIATTVMACVAFDRLVRAILSYNCGGN